MNDVSVILPVFNGADMIEGCIQSIYSAGNRISEIIIIDDGSSDRTLFVAGRLAEEDPRIKVIHTENHGCYSARMEGIRASSSPYIAFIDVDDRYLKGAIDLLADLLENYDADVAIGGYKEAASLSEQVEIDEPKDNILLSSEQMWPRIMKWKTQEFVNYVWNKLYKKELFSDMVEQNGINQGEDVLITCQVFINVKRIVETTTPVYLYYQNNESLTRTGFGASDLNLIRVWDTIVGVMKERRPDLLQMAQFNRWRTDFTLMTRLILVDDKEADKKYKEDLQRWRSSLKEHWKYLISAHAMPRNRELLLVGLRFLFTPTKMLMRIGRKLTKKDTNVILHSGDKR